MAELSPEVTQLLLDRVENYEQLEVLLLLCRDRSTPWTADGVGQKLRISTLVATKALDDLARARLVREEPTTRPGVYRFEPESADTAATIEELLRSYDRNCLDVVQVMNGRAMDRARSAARAFADAFIIGRGRGK